jgi:hypothetical protein
MVYFNGTQCITIICLFRHYIMQHFPSSAWLNCFHMTSVHTNQLQYMCKLIYLLQVFSALRLRSEKLGNCHLSGKFISVPVFCFVYSFNHG